MEITKKIYLMIETNAVAKIEWIMQFKSTLYLADFKYNCLVYKVDTYLKNLIMNNL